MKDIVVDTNILRLIGKAKDPEFVSFFSWLRKIGVLTVSTYLIKEYSGVGSPEIAALIEALKHSTPCRFNKVRKTEIDRFDDRHFKYACNFRDRCHVKLVMLSCRKIAISQDNNFINDVNRFPRYHARASNRPSGLNYE
jgi:hypothetical protein